MAAVTTKKPGADRAVQLTFPTVFEYTYAAEGIPEAYYPEEESAAPALPEGTDLQADYHRQKQADANRMAMAGVAATKAAERRFLTSHANYYDLPPVVLGQRIYANPSYGTGQVDLYSARRDQGVLVGGVLRTAEGQSYGRQLLQARVAQLDAIDAAQSMQQPESSRLPPVASEMGVEPTGETASNVLLELSAGLETLRSSLITGEFSTVEAKDVLRTMQLLYRVVPTASREEQEGLLSILQSIVGNGLEFYLELREARGVMEQAREMDAEIPEEAQVYLEEDKRRFFSLVYPLVVQATQYVEEMSSEENMNRPPKERLALSKALVKKYGLRSAQEAAKKAAEYMIDYTPITRPYAARLQAEEARREARRQMQPLQQRQAQVIAEMDALNQQMRRRMPAPAAPGAGAGAEAAEDDPVRQFRQAIEGIEEPEADRLFRAAIRRRFQERQAQREREAQAARRIDGRGMRGGAMRMPHAVAPMSSSFTRQAPTREDSEHADSAYATFFGEGAMKPKQRVRGGEVLGREPRNTIHFDHDQRNTFADRSGSYFREGSAGDYPATPGMETAPNVQNTMNTFRQSLDNTLPMRVSEAALPLFPEGAAPAAAMDAAAMQGEGNHRRRAQLLKKIRQGGMDGDTSKTPRTAAYRAMLRASEKRGELASEAAKAAFSDKVEKDRVYRAEVSATEAKRLARRAATLAKHGDKVLVVRPVAAAAAERDDGRAAPGAGAAPAPKAANPSAKKRVEMGLSASGMSRAALPKDREGFVALAEKLRSQGHSIRVNKNSKLASIRANFIRKLGL